MRRSAGMPPPVWCSSPSAAIDPLPHRPRQEAPTSIANELGPLHTRRGISQVAGTLGLGMAGAASFAASEQSASIAVRHEEAAAFMASGYVKHTGKLGVCLATTQRT